MTWKPDGLPNGEQLERLSFAAGLRSSFAPLLSISQWADRFRVLSKSSASESGRWVTDRTPYLREIMDVLSPSDPTERVVFQKCTQIGGTETGNNWIGSIVHHGLGPTMIVLPTSNAAKKASKTRIGPMIADTPVLRARVREARSRDSGNTTLLKEFDGGVLIFAGANSATELKSSPVRNLFLDEIEEYPPDVDGQGDPEELAEKRTDTFAWRKIFKVSTPTITGGRIDRAYQASDQRIYLVPCPHCKHEQELRFERLRWETAKAWHLLSAETGELQIVPAETEGATEYDTGDVIDEWYECEDCGQPIREAHKTGMLAAGRWEARNPGPGRAAGFRINALYSPAGWFPWRRIVEKHLEAEADTTGQLKKTFANTIKGEAYEDKGDAIEPHFLSRRIESWRVGEIVPAGALLLTAGVDVQGNRLEVRVWGYGRKDESWFIDRHVIWGSPAVPDTWQALEAMLERRWPHELGGEARIMAMAIDASDGNTTHFVRAFARKMAPGRRVIAVKGQAVQGKPLLGKPTQQDVTHRGTLIKGGVKLWPMGSDTGKHAFYARLRIEQPGPGYVHLPSGLPDEALEQLTAERVKTRYIRGHPVREWHLPSGRRNEDLDCRVMADAAAEYAGIRRAQWTRLAEQLSKKQPETREEQKETAQPQQIFAQARGPRNWVSGWRA